MDGYNTLHEMLGSALKQAGEECGMLLGQELSIALSDSLSTTKTSYFGGLDDASFVIGVDSGESYVGRFYLVFSLRDAIVMSSILLGIPPARIQEKKRLCIIEHDDIDAFSEIANMVNGSFNTVFQDTLANKAHLKLLPPKKFVPEVDQLSEDEPLPEGEYLMFRSKLEMAGQELEYLDVLIPVVLGNLFDPSVEGAAEDLFEAPSETGPEAVTKAASVPPVDAADDGESSEVLTEVTIGVPTEVPTEVPAEEVGADSIVVLEDDDGERQQMVEAVAFTGYQVVEGTLDADIKELFSGCNVRLVLIGSLDADDRELAVCIKINAIRQDAPPPIIMSAHRWTRTAVLKALKYGAREIIIKPCGEDELAAKVRKFCKLAQP